MAQQVKVKPYNLRFKQWKEKLTPKSCAVTCVCVCMCVHMQAHVLIF